MSELKDLTPDMIKAALIVASVLIAFILLVWGLIDKIKAAKKPKDDLAQWQRDTDAKLDRDNKRLNDLEASNGITLRSLDALISHELNGNSQEKLKKSRQEIMDFLTKR